MSYRVGFWPSLPRVECDGADCESVETFDTNVIPPCIANGTPPAPGWDTNVVNGRRVDHCPLCLRRPTLGGERP